MDLPLPHGLPAGQPGTFDRKDAALRKAAEQLESSFLAEMLKFTGAQGTPGAFGGGIGEEQFASFLVQARADAMVRQGGIGLAEKIYAQLKERANGTD